MATDRAALKIQESGALGSFQTAGVAVAAPVQTASLAHSDSYSSGVKSADDAMASTTTAEAALHLSIPSTPFTGVPRAYQVNRIVYTPVTGALTNDNTNFATITVSYRLAATGGTLTTLGTLATTITALGATIAQWQEAAFTPTTANVTVPAGATLTYSIAKAGSGVVVRGGTITVDGEWV